MVWTLLLTLFACKTKALESGDFIIDIDDEAGSLTITHAARGVLLEDLRFAAGTGSADIQMQYGSFLFDDVEASLTEANAITDVTGDDGFWLLQLDDRSGAAGVVTLEVVADDMVITWEPADASNRLSVSANCEPGEPFLGLGGHSQDVNHAGEAFPLWVSEPGVGKLTTDEPAGDWFLTGTKHAASYPVPFLLRPEQKHGLLALTTARVEVDLCASDPDRFSLQTWDEGGGAFVLISGSDPLDIVEGLTAYTGRPELPPAWAFAPWNDAVRGEDRVREVAAALREAGAPGSVIWSEDWKGGHENATGYHLDGDWFLDESLYPDPAAVDAELEALGFKWFSYFSPFLFEGTETWDDALAADVILEDEAGEPYVFFGATLSETSMVDLSTSAGREWAQEKMQASLDLGFDGWMADFAEWLPTDVSLRGGQDPMLAHNAYPSWWQETNMELLADQDATIFVRSGWAGTSGLGPIVWGGDQQTSFGEDDGLPTVIAMGLGLAASGVPIFTHDVSGYSTVGVDNSTKELWFRWAALGAFSPILRTHHGAYDQENWQFDSDAETLAFWADISRENMRLYPYRYGLARAASDKGTPMLLPTAFLFDGEDWDRKDAWMLGSALLVAPVVEEGAEGRDVDLPADADWYDWWTLAPASSGYMDAPLGTIPVFAASGTTVPTFAEVPDTIAPATSEGVLDLADVDGARVVYLFGGGGDFIEGDGTRYEPSGSPSGSGEETATLTSGEVEVAGVTVAVDGPIERTYTFVVP